MMSTAPARHGSGLSLRLSLRWSLRLSRRLPSRRSLAAAGLCLLAGCAAPPAEYFYTLNNSGGAIPAAAGPVRLYLEVLPVELPAQVSRNQLVVTAGDGRVELLEQQRWAAPLAGEIGQALSFELSANLGALDVRRTPHAEQLPVYRISTNVQRFESAPGAYALVDAVWSVRQVSGTGLLTCRSVVREQVGSGYDALVAGHRRAVAKIALDMGKAVQGFAAGTAPACPI